MRGTGDAGVPGSEPGPAASSDDDAGGAVRQRILVVEDDEDLRAFVAGRLRRAGYAVEAVGDGTAAWTALTAADPPDAVILDLMLPGIGGYGLLARCQRDDRLREVPTIVLTARTRDAAEAAAYDRGADEFISKPFDVEVLLARLDRVIA